MLPGISINDHSKEWINLLEKFNEKKTAEEGEFQPVRLLKEVVQQKYRRLYYSLKYSPPLEKATLTLAASLALFATLKDPIGTVRTVLKDPTFIQIASSKAAQLSFEAFSKMCHSLIKKDTTFNEGDIKLRNKTLINVYLAHEKKAFIYLIPPEVLLQIFDILNIKDQSNFPLVCKEWKDWYNSDSFRPFIKRRWRPHRIALHLKNVSDFTKRHSHIRIDLLHNLILQLPIIDTSN